MKEDVFHFGKGAFPAMSDYWRGFPFLFWREDWYIPFWSFRSSKRGLSKELYHWRPQSSNFALLWSLHFTPQVFDYSRCSVAEVLQLRILFWSTSPWAPPLKLYSKKLSTKPNLWNFQFPMVQMLIHVLLKCLFLGPIFEVAHLLFGFLGTGFFHRFPVEWPVSRIVLVWLQQLLDLKSWKERWNQAFGFR